MASIHNHANDDPRAGRAYVKLDEKAFPEMVARDLWLPLDTGGRLLLRLSREREKDDAQFYFGKAFRRLKLIEGEMVRNCADKASRMCYNATKVSLLIGFLSVDDTFHPVVPLAENAQKAVPRVYWSDAYNYQRSAEQDYGGLSIGNVAVREPHSCRQGTEPLEDQPKTDGCADRECYRPFARLL